MKKSMFVLLCCTIAFTAYSKKRPAPAPPAPVHPIESKTLAGFWQKAVIIESGDGRYLYLGTGDFKVIGTDSTYYMFNVRPFSAKATGVEPSTLSLVLHYGTYKATSDSTYEEHIAGSYMGAMADYSVIDLKYQWVNPDIIAVNCGAKGREKRISEIWCRMTPFDPDNQGVLFGKTQQGPLPPMLQNMSQK